MSSRIVRSAVFAAAIIGLASNARAATVTVDCSGGPSDYPTLGAALAALDIHGPHVILVSGTCNESVYVTNREHVRIEAGGGPGSAAIAWDTAPERALTVFLASDVTISGLVILGGGVQVGASSVAIDHTTIQDTSGVGLSVGPGAFVRVMDGCVVKNGTGTAVSIGPGANVILRDVAVQENATGISARGATLQVDGALTVENHANGLGVSMVGGFVRFDTWAGDNVIARNAAGIDLQGTTAIFNGNNRINDNTSYGVQVAGAGSARFNGGTGGAAHIDHNGTLGLNIAAAASVTFNGPHKIQNNGAGAAASDWRGGLRVGSVSRVQLSGGTEISGNFGPGIQAEFNGGMFLGDTVITSNTEEGTRILRNSVANLDAAMLAGNVLASVTCDSTALVIAGTATLGPVRCPRIERENGPPRPGIIKR